MFYLFTSRHTRIFQSIIHGPLYITVGFSYRTTPDKVSLVFPSFGYLLATKPMAKWSKASGQSSGGLWDENTAEMS